MELRATNYDVRGRTAVITLSRTHRANAWNGRMHAEWRFLLDQAEADPGVRTIVVTGDGKYFSVGGDAQALDGHADRGGYDDGLTGNEARPGFGVSPHFDHPLAFQLGLSKPLLAAINGAAAGVALVLACFCDIRFATPEAKMTTAHGKLNLPAEYGLSWMLPRLIGLSAATELLMSSRIFTGEEAHRLGLVHRLAGADKVLDATVDYAEEMARWVSPRSLAETRRQIYLDQHRDVGTSITESLRLLNEMVAENDFAKGTQAIANRECPEF